MISDLGDKLKFAGVKIPVSSEKVEKIITVEAIDSFEDKSIPITFGESVKHSSISYMEKYLEDNDVLKCGFILKSDIKNNLYIYTDDFIIKASFKRDKKDVAVFYIGHLEEEVAELFYIRTAQVFIQNNEDYIYNENNTENLYKILENRANAIFSEPIIPQELECFKNSQIGSIELNFKPPHHYLTDEKNLISNIKNETLELFQHKVNRDKVILSGNNLQIKCQVHRTNFNVTDEIQKEFFISEPNQYKKFSINGNLFSINYGDQKVKRKENHHLICFLKPNQEIKKDIVSVKKFAPLLSIEAETKHVASYNYKNIILSGVAGVGKTHNYKKLINLIENNVAENDIFTRLIDSTKVDEVVPKERIEFITFHQNYSYEEFIEGFRPNENSGIKIEKGLFQDFVIKAKEDNQNNYYFVIDEINRGNISKIFGELITLIEDSKRDTLSVRLPYSKAEFSIPNNIFIIGTMNITDQSISKIDIALRRRFIFINIKPNYKLVCEEFRERFYELNEFISDNLGDDYLIGHSYFMSCNKDNLDFILDYQIKPLLQDYFYGDKESLENSYQLLE